MESALASASAIGDQRQKIEQYKHILSSVFVSNDIAQAKKFIDHMLSDDVPLVVSWQLLQTFAQELGWLESELQKEIAHYTLNQIQPRVASFEEQIGIGSNTTTEPVLDAAKELISRSSYLFSEEFLSKPNPLSSQMKAALRREGELSGLAS